MSSWGRGQLGACWPTACQRTCLSQSSSWRQGLKTCCLAAPASHGKYTCQQHSPTIFPMTSTTGSTTRSPQTGMDGRVMYWPRGRVWGGSSSLNAMVYVRGHAEDYNRWHREGAGGWDYEHCLPYFRKAQTHELGGDRYRGSSGPLHVSQGKTGHPLHRAFIEAGQQAGYPFTEDMNGYQQEGFGWMDMTIHKVAQDKVGFKCTHIIRTLDFNSKPANYEGARHVIRPLRLSLLLPKSPFCFKSWFFYSHLTVGKRWSTASAYLRPALSRPNVKAEVHCLTTRVLFDGTRAVGVEYQQNGQMKKVGQGSKVFADKEVILSGGAINSPQLLMLSGVGDGDDLQKLDIPVIQHLPGVGSNLQDHLEVHVQQQCTQPITLFKAQKPFHMLKIGLEWLLCFTAYFAGERAFFYVGTNPGVKHSIRLLGYGATAHLESGAFIRSRPSVTHPDIQFHFLPSQVIDHGRIRPTTEAYQVSVKHGTCSYIDVWELRQCMKLAREIFAQKAFAPFRGPEVLPGAAVQSDKDIDALVRRKAESAYHPSCTCKMGRPTDRAAVVDPETRVYGLDGLRVVDASIMPSMVSGNLNAPTIMIAEKAADAIKGLVPLCDPGVPVYQPPSLERQR
ncbi:hypothetical protein P4O66_003032 [Electrophorus voltai]|uniref:Glucose-methanol-choline oxidoreductase N-terminal domain-containing protein n=1 Tax=Electrophorus voltai TaxID=2609070 RepID=A0AAD8YUB5_9TELE|nr:hypothetical protein P4O66_003032 [Electrophorus voltai]